jgi:uncharacterized membrane protein YGL010W
MDENNLITTYSSSHQNPTNQLVHFFCVPIIYFNVMAFIYYYCPLPVTLALVAMTLIFYYRSLRSFLSLMIILNIVTLITCYLFASQPHFIKVNVVLFIVAWIGQFWGHKIEAKNPSFLQNLFFLLVGPAWVMAKLKMKLFKTHVS